MMILARMIPVSGVIFASTLPVLGIVMLLIIALSIAAAKSVGKKQHEDSQHQYKSSYENTVSSGMRITIGIITAILFTIILLGTAYLSKKTDNMFLYCISAFFGWRFLTKIQPTMFIWMPMIGWVIYIFVKFLLSAIVGMFVAPIVIARWVNKVIQNISIK